MTQPERGLLYVGIRGHVVALDRRSGTEVWRTRLRIPLTRVPGLVFVCRDGDLLFATSAGQVSCLDPRTGSVLWHNPLRGLGLGLASLAGEQAAMSPALAGFTAAQTRLGAP